MVVDNSTEKSKGWHLSVQGAPTPRFPCVHKVVERNVLCPGMAVPMVLRRGCGWTKTQCTYEFSTHWIFEREYGPGQERQDQD